MNQFLHIKRNFSVIFNPYFIRISLVFVFILNLAISYAADKPQIEFAKLQISQKSYKAAISTLNNYITDNPKDVDALYWRAFAFYKDKQFEIAEIKFNEVLKINPNYVPALETLGIMCYEKKDYTTAVRYFNSIIAGNDTSREYYNMRGMCYFYNDNYDQAVKDFN
nr:tetratricopeptide repeat protein [Chitinophagaceae bacterium]